MSFFNRWSSSSELVGLDVGSSALKVAQLAVKKSKFSLIKLGFIGLPAGTVVNGEIIDAYTLEGAIKELFKKEKINAQSVAFSVCGNAVISENISLPAISEEELEDQISIVAAQYIPFPMDEMNVDYQVLPNLNNEAQTLNINVIAVRKKFLDSYLSVIEAADLKSTTVDTTVTALSNIFANSVSDSGTVALIHMGASMTHFIVIKNGLSYFNREIEFGGQTISEDIREKLKLNVEESEALKISSLQEKHLPQETSDIIEQSCEQVISEIQKSINLFIQQDATAHIDKIYLSGGTSKIAPMIDWVSNQTGISTEQFNPFNNIQCDLKKYSQAYLEDVGPIFSVALGLATRSQNA